MMEDLGKLGRYRRLSREKKRLKRRLVLASMIFVGTACGVLYLFRDNHAAYTTRGLSRRENGGDARQLGQQQRDNHNRIPRNSSVERWTSAILAGAEDKSVGGVDDGKYQRGREMSAGVTLEGVQQQADNVGKGRLLASANCKEETAGAGMTVLYVIGIVYSFLGLAIVCDEFFQTSLEIISEVLRLTPDVAGATFLAAGSSAPELFTSLTDAFGAANSTGTGTIVGSAMFNILVIVALSAAVAGQNGNSIFIDWRPVCRDVTFYSYSILILCLVFLDSEVQWWEGFIMVASYGFYIVFMKYNTVILGHCQSTKIGITDEQPGTGAASGANPDDVAKAVNAVNTAKRTSHGGGAEGGEVTAKVSPSPAQDDGKTADGSAENGAAAENDKNANPTRKSATLGVRNRVERRKSGGLTSTDSQPEGSAMLTKGDSSKGLVGADQNQAVADEEAGLAEAAAAAAAATTAAATPTGAAGETGADSAAGGAGMSGAEGKEGANGGAEEGEESRFKWPDGLSDQVLYVLGFPLLVTFTFTIPDCGKARWRQWYVVSFIMSLWWIGALTHFMVEWATEVGCSLDVSPIFMGLVVLAIGTSVPDALGSMIAAKSGEANMAIANAVGSNVFDILIGLGVPWFLRGLILHEPMPVNRDGIFVNVIILFCTGLMFTIVLAMNRWVMKTLTGIFLFSLYLAYIIYVVVNELS